MTLSDLRSRTIRLAHANPVVRAALLDILVADRVAMEFDTKEQLEAYLKDHPNADKSKHRVRTPGDGMFSKVHEDDLTDKLVEHVQHVVFDDFHDAWKESKGAFNDIVGAVKDTASGRKILDNLKGASTATKTFVANPEYRREKMKGLGESIKSGAKSLGSRILHAAKAEVHEVGVGVKALRQVLTPGSEPLDKKQKKALYGLGAYAAGACIAAAGGGALVAAGAMGKSFSLHVGIKAVSHLADSLFVHYEWAHEALHAKHLLHAMSHIASERRGADGDADIDAAVVQAVVLAVSKVLSEGMDDDEVKSMLSGKDVDAYDDVADIPGIDKLKEKGSKSDKSKSDKSKSDKSKSDKSGSLRERTIRLAHARPDLRAHLLSALAG